MQKVVVLIILCSGALGAGDLRNSFKQKSFKNYAYDFHNSFEKSDDVYDFSTPYEGSRTYRFPSYSVAASPHTYKGFKYQRGRPYSFGYDVVDKYEGLAFGHKQDSDGKTVTGAYDTLLPDGRLQRVTYIADENGYRANVRYEHGAAATLLRNQNSHEINGLILDNGPSLRTHQRVVYPIDRRPYYIHKYQY